MAASSATSASSARTAPGVLLGAELGERLAVRVQRRHAPSLPRQPLDAAAPDALRASGDDRDPLHPPLRSTPSESAAAPGRSCGGGCLKAGGSELRQKPPWRRSSRSAVMDRLDRAISLSWRAFSARRGAPVGA
jgi:hypothetical protein